MNTLEIATGLATRRLKVAHRNIRAILANAADLMTVTESDREYVRTAESAIRDADLLREQVEIVRALTEHLSVLSAITEDA